MCMETRFRHPLLISMSLGVKNDFLQGALSVNLTAYRIINHNLAQTAQFAQME